MRGSRCGGDGHHGKARGVAGGERDHGRDRERTGQRRSGRGKRAQHAHVAAAASGVISAGQRPRKRAEQPRGKTGARASRRMLVKLSVVAVAPAPAPVLMTVLLLLLLLLLVVVVDWWWRWW